jgi:hypothetical protein
MASAAPAVASSPDADLARRAVLTPEDLGEGWRTVDERLVFPNSAELARTVPACEPFAELVFQGGAQHGSGVSEALLERSEPVFTYVVVFPTEAEAAAMIAATASPGFSACWAGFNEVAVPSMPLGVEAASYNVGTPPVLAFEADESTVLFLEGTVTIGGADFKDTCACVFARAGRGVVEVHSTLTALDADARSGVVQAAVDKLRATLTPP